MHPLTDTAKAVVNSSAPGDCLTRARALVRCLSQADLDGFPPSSLAELHEDIERLTSLVSPGRPVRTDQTFDEMRRIAGRVEQLLGTWQPESVALTPNAQVSPDSHAPRQLQKKVKQSEIVLLVHGIRTRASWAPMVVRVLGEIPNTRVIPLSYGYFDVFRFLYPLWTRQGVITEIRREIQNARASNPKARVSVIAHSFGTFAMSQILYDNPDLRLHRLVLVGSIVPRRFRWDLIRSKHIDNDILNEVGSRDIWPVLAKCMSWGYGDTGRHGFGRGANIVDRVHNCGHSDFLRESFVRPFWKPWFESGEIVRSEWAERAPPASLGLNLLSLIPLQWILLLSLLGGLGWWIASPKTPKDPPHSDSPAATLFRSTFVVPNAENVATTPYGFTTSDYTIIILGALLASKDPSDGLPNDQYKPLAIFHNRPRMYVTSEPGGKLSITDEQAQSGAKLLIKSHWNEKPDPGGFVDVISITPADLAQWRADGTATLWVKLDQGGSGFRVALTFTVQHVN